MNNEKYVTGKELENLGGETLDGSGFEDETPDDETPGNASVPPAILKNTGENPRSKVPQEP